MQHLYKHELGHIVHCKFLIKQEELIIIHVKLRESPLAEFEVSLSFFGQLWTKLLHSGFQIFTIGYKMPELGYFKLTQNKESTGFYV